MKKIILNTILSSVLVGASSAAAQQAPAPSAGVPAPSNGATAAPPSADQPPAEGVGPKATTAKPATVKPAEPPRPPAPTRDARIRDLEAKVERLTKAVTDMKAASPSPAATPSPSAAPPVATDVPAAPQTSPELDPLRGIVITGYLQAQLENHEDSEDQLRPGGAPYNQNRFLIRRGRIRFEREWEFSSVMMEVDGNTTKGPAIQLFKAEASLLWRAGKPKPAPPAVRVTLGLFDVPFGYEVLESPRQRYFMERSLQSRAFFPTEPDLGIRIAGELDWFRYAFAVTNGQPLGTPDGFAGQDPNNHKDFIGHVAAVAKPTKDSEVWGGISMLNGLGFVKGTDATKNQLVWTDSNEDRRVSSDEIFAQPASAASPSYNFERWAVGADLGVKIKTPVGVGKVYGEIQLGSNMDRAFFIANPTISGQPSRELGYYLGFVQEVTAYGVLGFRFDHYDPNADFLGYQSGKQVPRSQVMNTYSPLVGATIPGRARLVFQYDYVRDSLGRTVDGIPTDLANDQWTLRLQGEL